MGEETGQEISEQEPENDFNQIEYEEYKGVRLGGAVPAALGARRGDRKTRVRESVCSVVLGAWVKQDHRSVSLPPAS